MSVSKAAQTEDNLLSELPPSQPLPAKKTKRYIPPRADANTFASQQAFLDSLHPESSEGLELARCPTCWKPFGEDPDPGFDNSESPVKLRCGHIFGDKCLSNTYRMPETSQFVLEPLGYEAGKKGLLLGQKLDAFVAKHPSPKSSQDFIKIFGDMLEESDQLGRGQQLFGSYWWPILQEVRGSRTADVTFMENAIIIDLQYAPRQQPTAPHKPYTFAKSSDKTVQQMLSEAKAHIAKIQAAAYPETTPATLPITPLFAEPQSTTTGSTASNPLGSLAKAGVAATIPSSTGEAQPWQTALAMETNLDKLTALKKTKKQSLPPKTTTKHSESTGALVPQNVQAYQAAVEEHKRQEIRAQEAHARALRERDDRIAHKLARVYENHQQTSTVEQDSSSLILLTQVRVHTGDREKTRFQIAPLGLFYNFGDEESEVDEDFDLSKYTLLVTRLICDSASCCSTTSCAAIEQRSTLPVPRELFWRDEGKVPNDCSICHSVLFKKTADPYRRW